MAAVIDARSCEIEEQRERALRALLLQPLMTAEHDFNVRLQALVAENIPEDKGARRTAIRHRLSRRLLDDPVVYLDALGAPEREYFSHQRGPMGHRLAAATDVALATTATRSGRAVPLRQRRILV